MRNLDGNWELRREGEANWQPVRVPGCWEQAGAPKADPGPYWYRTHFQAPEETGRRIWLRFEGVSYASTIFVNGQRAGDHTGMWDAFNIEITQFVQPGRTVELLVQVEKPASLTAGPDSTYVSGNYPLRETLSGFLPYVWGHAFGGIWQKVVIYTTGDRYLTDVWVRGKPNGQVRGSISASSPGSVRIKITSPDGENISDQTQYIEKCTEIALLITDPRPWSTITPQLYTVHVILAGEDERVIRFGLRSFAALGNTITLNGLPIYPRLVLSWGWYSGRLDPDPGDDQVRADLLRLRSLGYNGVKLCLWFPPPYYFDLADEMGMLLWVELPMWLPQENEGYDDRALREYDRLVRQARQHPSVMLYTLGCELSQAVNEALVQQLYIQTKALTAGALVRDNSGSSEAYYGHLHEYADFYDNHLYSELQFLNPLLDTFAPGWRAKKPWLMGEFGDYDTFPTPTSQWWTSPDPAVNPQGARWEMRVTTHADRMNTYGIQEQINELAAASRRQALVHRKYTLETVRSRRELSGYVITGEADTPVSTAGMWDAYGRDKFYPDEFLPFNQDLVLTLRWDRRRAWIAGGDRPSRQDHYSYVSGSPVRIHLICSNYSPFSGGAKVSWEVAFCGEAAFISDNLSTPFKVVTGQVVELAVLEFTAPEVMTPRPATLRASIELDRQRFTNAWPLWFFPADPFAGVMLCGLYDSFNLFSDLPELSRERCLPGIAGASVVICSSWDGTVDTYVKHGGKAVVIEGLHNLPAPIPVTPVPYWREALKIVADHPAWGDFPHGNAPDMQFYTLAPDCALDVSGFRERIAPIYRRLDMRGMHFLEYAVELNWGLGRIIATTLRFSGGLGDQPTGLKYCPAGQHLLANWVRSLHQ